MSYLAPYISMLVLVGLLVVLIILLSYVVKIHGHVKGQNQNTASNPTLARILELLGEKQKGYTPAVPSGGSGEEPQNAVDVDCGLGHWRCLESRAGTQVSRIGKNGEALETFQVPSQPVEEVLWALCQLS